MRLWPASGVQSVAVRVEIAQRRISITSPVRFVEARNDVETAEVTSEIVPYLDTSPSKLTDGNLCRPGYTPRLSRSWCTASTSGQPLGGRVNVV